MSILCLIVGSAVGISGALAWRRKRWLVLSAVGVVVIASAATLLVVPTLWPTGGGALWAMGLGVGGIAAAAISGRRNHETRTR